MSNKLITVEKVELVPFFTKGEKVDDILTQIESEVSSFVPDVSTAKGRDAIKKMVTKVTKSKTYLESKGKDLAAEYKAIPKVIDENRRKVKESLTSLAESVRAPLTEWEAEQLRIATEKLEAEKAAKLAAQIESDHEIGLLLNEKFDRELQEQREAEAKAESERQAILAAEQAEREKRVAEEAAAKAKAEAEAERQAAIEREETAKRQAEEAERARIAAEERAKVEAEQAELRRIEAEKQAKIQAEEAAERSRIAEVERQQQEAARIAAEQAKREANKRHIGAIRGAAKECLMAKGLDEDTAKVIVLAIHNGEIANVTINY